MDTRHRYLLFAILCVFLSGLHSLPSAAASISAARNWPASSSIRPAGSTADVSATRSTIDLVASLEGSVAADALETTLLA
jgi:hypothetical protein